MKRTIQEIEAKIENGEATVLTAEEITKMALNGEKLSTTDVDVITTGTCGVMSGTMGIFHLPVAEPGSFKKARHILLNGIPGIPGPCPNEWLGSVDLIVYGTTHSLNDPDYGGGFLFKDLVKGKEIEVEVESSEGNVLRTPATLEDFGTAQLLGTRFAFKNYTAFVNPTSQPISSIFNAVDMLGPLKGLSFSGCGELNPLQNDPELNTLKKGAKVLLNSSEGIFIGQGTRSTPSKPNMMLTADMREMDSHYLGGYLTGAGPEVYNSVATAIPILDESILKRTFVKHEDIKLPIADIRGRHSVLSETDYGAVWNDVDERPQYREEDCRRCQECLVEERCPTGAFKNNYLNMQQCFGCGMCSFACPYQIFRMNTGQVKMDCDGEVMEIPVTCRQSDLKRARELAEELKNRIIKGEFSLRW
jgi:putative methanogenesis marker 16 metalloprotein